MYICIHRYIYIYRYTYMYMCMYIYVYLSLGITFLKGRSTFPKGNTNAYRYKVTTRSRLPTTLGFLALPPSIVK